MEAAALLAANLARVREQVAEATARCGRRAEEICLVGVTKYAGAEAAQGLAEAGVLDLGESRPQELWQKAAALAELPLRWHLIGHLQRNKVEKTLPLISLLHSGDRVRILEAVSAVALRQGRVIKTLLEVNISGDAAKHGFTPSELPGHLPQLADLRGIQIVGLMGMSALEGGSARASRDFAALRELRDSLRNGCPPPIDLKELSMGMSDDFAEAIMEGSTILRIGSALFGGLKSQEHD